MSPRSSVPYARIGWLATTLVLAVALMAGSWINYNGARAAVDTLNRGQADILETAMRDDFRSLTALPDSTVLAQMIADHPEAGIRYISLLDFEGAVVVSAGAPVDEPALPPPGTGPQGTQLFELEDRIRVYYPRPQIGFGRFGGGPGGPAGGGFRGGPSPNDSAPRDSAFFARLRADADAERPGVPAAGGNDNTGGQPGADPNQFGQTEAQRAAQGPPQNANFRPLSFALVEFEPVVASDLVGRSGRSMLIAWTAASILTFVSFLFWRTSQRFDDARAHLEEQKRLSVLGEMSAVLAHEIRNPLASLKGTAQLLAEKLPRESKERARANRIVHEAVRLEALTTDLLGFARSSPIELQPTDPVELIKESISEVAEDGFDLDPSGAPESWALDPTRVRHVLVNVLQNARQASPDAPPPTVRVSEESDDLVYEVRDFGEGLAEGTSERIFDPFFTTRTHGTGLGLAVARRVVEMHGGDISARNHPEGGAIFRIAFPRSEV